MANQLIIDELQFPAVWGLNTVTRAYTNPGGISRSDPAAIAAIEGNTALFNKNDDINVYRATLSPNEFFSILTAQGLQDLSAAKRDDYQAFVVPMLATEIQNPSGLLKELVDTVIFSGLGEDPGIRSGFDTLIQEQKSIAQLLGISVRASDIQEAMLSLGWIVN